VRHVNTHLKKIAEDPKAKKGGSFVVQVKCFEFFLTLWVDGKATFGDLDQFLRHIWLECCGHMSAFIDREGRYTHPKAAEADDPFGFFDSNPNEVPMNTKVEKVFCKGKKLMYEYDFGSTTMLDIEVKTDYPVAADKKIVLLSRNEPLKILCDGCQKAPAVEICGVHIYEGEGVFCAKCAKKHAKSCEDFADYAALPVVNSPRMGVCAYEGGIIDTERDGVYPAKDLK